MATGNIYPQQQQPVVFVGQTAIGQGQAMPTWVQAQPVGGQAQSATAVGPYSTGATRGNLRARGRLFTGSAQICCGILSAVLWVVSLPLACNYTEIGIGLWGGVLFIFTGAFGVSSVRVKGCRVTTYLVLSLLSGIIAGPSVVLYTVAATRESYYYYNYNGYFVYRTAQWVRILIDCLLLLMSLVECVNAIIGACFCCQCCCYDSKDMKTQQYVIYTQPGQEGYAVMQGIPVYNSTGPGVVQMPPPVVHNPGASIPHGPAVPSSPRQPPPYQEKEAPVV